MMRFSQILASKRTPGYVFWRQRTLVELEHAKRSYLLSERPYPLGEITRRMVRIRARYQDTGDFHERNLLRGEYKYFSGKLCDLRGASPSDMIAFLECGAFFGFWDTAQVDRVMDEVLLRLDELMPNELVHLLLCLPGLRRQQSALYKNVAQVLVDIVPELTLDEVVRLLHACEVEDPPQLIHSLLAVVSPNAGTHLTASQCVTVAEALACCDGATQRRFAGLLETVKLRAVAECHDLSVVTVAQLCEALCILGSLDPATTALLHATAVERVGEVDAHCMAVFFSAGGTFSFAEATEDRVLFLASSFTPGELCAVLRVYVDLYCSLTLVARGVAEASAPHASTNTGESGLRRAEQQFARQRLRSVGQMLRELNEQMTVLCDAAASYVPPEVLIAVLQCVGQCVESGTVLGMQEAEGVPRLRHLTNAASVRAIAGLRGFSTAQLFSMLECSNAIGTMMPDSVVGATLDELSLRDLDLTSEEAVAVQNRLVQMERLRTAHRGVVERDLIPRLRLLIAARDLDYAL